MSEKPIQTSDTNIGIVSVQPSVTARNAFMNALRILYNIDEPWLPASFFNNPVDFLIRADDPTVDKVWALIQARQPERYRG